MPRPTIETEHTPDGVEMLLFIPNKCIDEQSYNLTHDQIRHLTGVQLQDAYRRRRRVLEKGFWNGTNPSGPSPNATG